MDRLVDDDGANDVQRWPHAYRTRKGAPSTARSRCTCWGVTTGGFFPLEAGGLQMAAAGQCADLPADRG